MNHYEEGKRLGKLGSFFFIGVMVLSVAYWITGYEELVPFIAVCLFAQACFHGVGIYHARQWIKQIREENEREQGRHK